MIPKNVVNMTSLDMPPLKEVPAEPGDSEDSILIAQISAIFSAIYLVIYLAEAEEEAVPIPVL